MDSDIRKILVVLESELTGLSGAAALQNSTLLQRAALLVEATGSRLELFHACHDASIGEFRSASTAELAAAKKQLADRYANRLAEIAAEFRDRNIEVESGSVWDHPFADAVLRRLASGEYDLVMKHSDCPSYYVGLATHADWELLRRSPVHVWLVRDDVRQIDCMMSAIGSGAPPVDPVTAIDDAAFRIAAGLAQTFDARHVPVHVANLPPAAVSPAYASPLGAATATAAAVQEDWLRYTREEKETLEEFVSEQGATRVDPLHLEGWPARSIPEAAQRLQADLIVMGARSLSRWQRLFRAVTAEPVLARAGCDLLVVREADDVEAPVADELPVVGEAGIDPELAILDPASTFPSPGRVLDVDGFSVMLKKRILDAWERDIKKADESNGKLREIAVARQALGVTERTPDL